MNNSTIMNQIKSDVNAMFSAMKSIEGVKVIENRKPNYNHVIINNEKAFSFKINNMDITIVSDHSYFSHSKQFNVEFHELVLVVNDFIINANYKPIVLKGMQLEHITTGERVEVLHNYTEMTQQEELFNVVTYELNGKTNAIAENLLLSEFKLLSAPKEETSSTDMIDKLAKELAECRNSLEAAHNSNINSRAVKDHINGLQELECELLDYIHELNIEDEVFKKVYSEEVY